MAFSGTPDNYAGTYSGDPSQAYIAVQANIDVKENTPPFTQAVTISGSAINNTVALQGQQYFHVDQGFDIRAQAFFVFTYTGTRDN